MNYKLNHSLAIHICAFICWLVPSIIWASVEVDGIYYDLNTTAKTAAVASNPNYYTGAVDIPSSFVHNGSTYNVKSVSSRAFLSCSEMTSISFPSSVTTIGSSAFERCTGLTDVVIGSGVTLIDYEAFKNCSNLRSLTLPSSLKTIENETFSGCSFLSEIIAKRTTPPTIVSTTFDGVDKTACMVYVPEGCRSTYAKATNWKAFSNIVELKVVASGSCGDNVTYTIYSDMSMVISGTGPMHDLFIGNIGEDEEAEQFNNRENNEVWIQVKKVMIEEGVTSIGDYAFFDCKDLLSVILPNSVTSIGSFSFKECSNLTTITIPASVAIIGDYAFSYSGLTHFIIEDGGGVLLFGSTIGCGIEFFEECPLEYVYMGRDIEANNRSDVAMEQLIRWGDVTFPPFSGQGSLKTLVIGDNVTILEDYSFSGAPLQSLVIGKNVQTLGMFALTAANKGQTLVIPSNVTKVGEGCFSPFISNLVIEKGDNDLELYGGTYSTNLSFFVDCWDYSFVDSVYLGRKFTYISPYSPLNRFVSAYIDVELTSIPETVEYDDEGRVVTVLSYKTSPIQVTTNLYIGKDGAIDRYYFNGSGIEHIYNLNPSKAGDHAFANSGVKTISFDTNGSTAIASNIFEGCRGLTSLTIPEGVQEIGYSSFENCIRLECVKIPNSVTTIGNGAFFNCKLSDFYVGPIPAQIFETTFGFWGDEEEEEFQTEVEHTLHVPYGCKSAYENAEYWDYFDNIVEDGGNLDVLASGPCGDNVSYTLYSDMTMVISGIGAICNDFTETYIKDYRQSIQNLIIEEGITSIGDAAFCDCTDLTSVIIPNSVTLIDWFCFSDCINLVSISFPINETKIGGFAFCNTAWLDNQPNGVVYLGKAAYCYKGEMPEGTTIIIKDGTFSISGSAFSDCIGLVSVTFPTSLTSIDEDAFSGCSYLTSIYALGRTPAYAVEGSSFPDVDFSKCILYVPMGSKSAYQQEVPWCYFENIIEFEQGTDISALDNAIYVNQVEGRIGGTKDISVNLKNSYAVRGFQFTMELPEGTTINSWALSKNRLPSGATLSDKIATQKIEGNKISVACSLNYGDASFTGNDGEIATVNVSFGEDMEEGSYPIYITACDVTTASGVDEDLSDVKATLVLEDYVVGDANGDGKVRIGDATTILNYIVGTTSDNFNEKAADANGDGKIRIGDATTILNIIVNQ